MAKRTDNPLTAEDESLLDEPVTYDPNPDLTAPANPATPDTAQSLTGAATAAQAPPAPTAEEAQAAQQARPEATRRVRANANLAGLEWGEEGDLPDDAELASLLAAGLVTDLDAEKAEKGREKPTDER